MESELQQKFRANARNVFSRRFVSVDKIQCLKENCTQKMIYF